MKKTALIILGVLTSFCFGFYINAMSTKQQSDINSKRISKVKTTKKKESMKLGAFSISLSVKDLKASKQFYENLGFTVFGGGLEKNYLIMKNENSLIGLFKGMFENNIITFNPGWDENAKNVAKFDDIREIQRQLKNKGMRISIEVDEKTSGPASFMITDPDGNVILIDQHR